MRRSRPTAVRGSRAAVSQPCRGCPTWRSSGRRGCTSPPETPSRSQALRSLGAGDHGEAARLFRQAADAWSGRHLRGEVRSGWGEGEALRRDGQTALATDRLVEVEARAEQLGFVPMLGRMRRSLRLLGVRRSAPRRVVADLTGREHQLLELAAAGQTSAQIARRLGVGRPTVDRIIASAMLKLGAETRAQAVALAAQR